VDIPPVRNGIRMAIPNTTLPTRLARIAIGWLSISPFLIALHLAFDIFPSLPVLEHLRTRPVLAVGGWVALGPLGVATILLLRQRPVAGTLLAVLFGAAYLPLARLVWGFRWYGWGIWISIIAVVLAVIGLVLWQRSNESPSDPS
jgi:hypothetical protein